MSERRPEERSAVTLSPRHGFVLTCSWMTIAAVTLGNLAWAYEAGMRFSPRPLGVILTASSLLLMLSAVYRYARRDDVIWLGTQVASQLIVGSFALATFSYLCLILPTPLRDPLFSAWDESLGFHWLAYVGWVDSHPLIARLLTASYIATGPELLALLLIFAALKQFNALHRLALGYLLGGLITVVIAGFLPAVSAYVYHHISPAAYPHLQVQDASSYQGDFFAMRSHALRVFPEEFQGIVAFPSFHSLLAMLAIFSAAALRNRLLKYAVILLNILMIVSTPVDGGHYLVDTLSGILVSLPVFVLCMAWLPSPKER